LLTPALLLQLSCVYVAELPAVDGEPEGVAYRLNNYPVALNAYPYPLALYQPYRLSDSLRYYDDTLPSRTGLNG